MNIKDTEILNEEWIKNSECTGTLDYFIIINSKFDNVDINLERVEKLVIIDSKFNNVKFKIDSNIELLSIESSEFNNSSLKLKDVEKFIATDSDLELNELEVDNVREIKAHGLTVIRGNEKATLYTNKGKLEGSELECTDGELIKTILYDEQPKQIYNKEEPEETEEQVANND